MELDLDHDREADLELDAGAALAAERDRATAHAADYARMSDVDEFVARTLDYVAGKVTSDEYRAYRLTRGVYGQRQDNVFMMRVKIPGGMLKADQARALAEVVEQAPEKVGHITTRENLQIHHFALNDVESWMRKLAAVGLTMREACGNAVRNVTQDPLAGLAPDEAFDTTPYLDAIVRFFLRNPRAAGLPRKFKIALSTSRADRAYAAIHDVGLIAVRGPDGAPAFKFLCGGGLASMPRSGLCLHEAWPARDILTPMLAVIDFFQVHGNRKVRSKARIKHVLRKMGDATFTATYHEFLAKVQQDPPPALDDIAPTWSVATPWTYTPPDDDIAQRSGLAEWARTSVQETRLPGLVFVTVRLDDGGSVTAANLRDLAELSETFGDGIVRATPQQNAVLRPIPVARLADLYRELKARGLGKAGAGTTTDITSCPGGATCNLALTLSRNLAAEFVTLLAARTDRDLTIKISGCHNSCGQHHIGTIGFYGALKRIGGRPAPHYRVMVGGGVDASGATFGDDLGLVPSKRVAEAVQRLLAHADAQRGPDETTGAWLRRTDKLALRPVIADLLEFDDGAAQESDFWDIGATQPFLGETREGECAA
ncbi:MAG: nitrite/sulfite reductase [Myxococcales bacterium]|nr:nitrite/sulfite reductase [Myxococcales bacterium]